MALVVIRDSHAQEMSEWTDAIIQKTLAGARGLSLARKFFCVFPRTSISPEITESEKRKLRIANRVSNVLVAQVVLDRARVVPLVG